MALAQAGSARAVTLAEALAAIPKSPERQVARLETDAANKRVDAAGAWPETHVSLSTNLRTARLSPALSVPLPVFGTLSADRHAAQAELSVAQASEAGAELELRRRVRTAWIDLFRAQAAADLALQAAAHQKELSDITARRFEAGESPHAEVVAADAENARMQSQARVAQAAIGTASAGLAGILGWPPEVTLAAEGAPPDAQLPTSLPALIARTSAHPEVRTAQARVSASSALIAVQERRALPQLSLDLEAAIADPTLPGSDLRAGVGVSLPLFGRTSEAQRAAVAERSVAQAEQSATQHAIAAQIVTAYRRCQVAVERVSSLRDSVLPAQREAEKLARAAYTEGQQGFAAVIVAERALVEVEREALDARIELALALSELEWSVGGSP